ncbi:MAG: DUF1045 domain-containing protein [Pseudomonadota bacterium]
MLARKTLSSLVTNNEKIEKYERYALYYLPSENSVLADLGRDWFGYDIYCQGLLKRPNTFGLSSVFLDRITELVKRYSLHATLKAPFYLNDGYTLDMLKDRLKRFCQNRYSFEIEPLDLQQHNSTLRFSLPKKSEKIDQLASQCMLAFDEFRAPLSVAERTRRLDEALTLHQRLMLEAYGYPYVLSEFQFHMNLTSQLKDEDLEIARVGLAPLMQKITSIPLKIGAISLVGDPGANQPFHLIETFLFAN